MLILTKILYKHQFYNQSVNCKFTLGFLLPNSLIQGLLVGSHFLTKLYIKICFVFINAFHMCSKVFKDAVRWLLLEWHYTYKWNIKNIVDKFKIVDRNWEYNCKIICLYLFNFHNELIISHQSVFQSIIWHSLRTYSKFVLPSHKLS